MKLDRLGFLPNVAILVFDDLRLSLVNRFLSVFL